MSATNNANRCFPWRLACAISVVFAIAAAQDSRAVDPAKLGQQAQARAAEASEEQLDDSNRADEDRQLQGARDREQPERDRHADWNQEGFPAFHPPWPRPRHWLLGVRVQYQDTGARVTSVSRNTPAARVGLERRDVIVSIDGYQIGYVNRRLYEISTELNARAGRSGRVRLLVQNCRNNQLVNVDVQLARIGAGFPRERFGIPPGSRLDHAEGDERQRDAVEPEPKSRVPSEVE